MESSLRRDDEFPSPASRGSIGTKHNRSNEIITPSTEDEDITQSDDMESLTESLEDITISFDSKSERLTEDNGEGNSEPNASIIPIHLPVVVSLSDDRWNKRKLKKSMRPKHGNSRAREFYQSQLIISMTDDPLPALSNPIVCTTILERITQLG